MATIPASAPAMQEFMILPVGVAKFADAMNLGCEVYHYLKGLIKEKYGRIRATWATRGFRSEHRIQRRGAEYSEPGN